jgi:hypothetical protein
VLLLLRFNLVHHRGLTVVKDIAIFFIIGLIIIRVKFIITLVISSLVAFVLFILVGLLTIMFFISLVTIIFVDVTLHLTESHSGLTMTYSYEGGLDHSHVLRDVSVIFDVIFRRLHDVID